MGAFHPPFRKRATFPLRMEGRLGGEAEKAVCVCVILSHSCDLRMSGQEAALGA